MYIFVILKLQLAEELSVEKIIACFPSVVSVILKGYQWAACYVYVLPGPIGIPF